jgi:4-hydroxybenzoate polyprenyltransferase|tara:strand:+ start:1178 stop:2089 length:912 start_codon:yes stop_codon:yes gene_type:complete
MEVVFDIYKSLINMNQLKLFIDLSRLNKPIGFMLLFWPCCWGLALAYNVEKDIDKFLFFLILFFLGSVFMRSAGCIFNDIVDIEIDKKVKRTKNRPLASGKITVGRSYLYIILLCLTSLLILIQFNKLTIILGLVSMLFAFSYPFMKRITYWPQLFLGLTFNWGAVMAWTSIMNYISFEIIVLYLAAIFWTLGYDTIYGAQDITDDEIIGNKSTSIKFKKNIKLFVSICYLISTALIFLLFNYEIKMNFISILTFIFILSLIYQIKIFNRNEPNKCLLAFKINNFTGLILFLNILGLSNGINI